MNISNYPILSLYWKDGYELLDGAIIKTIIGNDTDLDSTIISNISNYPDLLNKVWNGILFNLNDQSLISRYKNILSQKIVDNTAYVDFVGFKILPIDPMSYATTFSNAKSFKVNCKLGEQTLADLLKNNYKYEVDFINQEYNLASDNDIKVNFDKLRLRKSISYKVGDVEDILADHSKLIQFLLIALKDKLPLQFQEELNQYLPDVNVKSLRKLLERLNAIDYTRKQYRD